MALKIDVGLPMLVTVLISLLFVDLVEDVAMAASAAEGIHQRGTLEFQHDEAEGVIVIRDVKNLSVTDRNTSTYELGLGEDIEGSLISTDIESIRADNVVVQFQWETSVSIDDEGAHLDLLEWRHYTSPWTELEPDENGYLRVPILTEGQQQRFPETEVSEVCTAVEEYRKEKWIKKCETATAVGAYPIRVGVSAYRFRIGAPNTSNWDFAPMVEVRKPLGS